MKTKLFTAAPITEFPRLTDNPVSDTDSYKLGHFNQYPPDVTSMYSYFESRGGYYRGGPFVGLQYYILHYMLQPITKAHVEEMADFCPKHGLPFNREGWDYLVEKYGHFPVRIRSVEEGTFVPTGNALFDIELTASDPKVFWVVSWLETLLVRVWYPMTVAALSYRCKEMILEALQETSDNPAAEIDFKLHDFGSRGASSMETARIGGAAHLVNFKGSDTVEGIRCANHYYFDEMAAFSIPAAEHSTITMWGRSHEFDAYMNFVKENLRKGQLAACVSDSYDIRNAVENGWCEGRLLEAVKSSGGTLVIRPDSGDAEEILPELCDIIDRKLGTRRNGRGFKLLPAYYRLIQGDGITDRSIPGILRALISRGYSITNLAFGMGGGLLQQVNRDTMKCAFKCAAALRDGTWIDVSKDPITDSGKRSKKGHQALVRENGKFSTVRGPVMNDRLVLRYENGKAYNLVTMDQMRANATKASL